MSSSGPDRGTAVRSRGWVASLLGANATHLLDQSYTLNSYRKDQNVPGAYRPWESLFLFSVNMYVHHFRENIQSCLNLFL